MKGTKFCLPLFTRTSSINPQNIIFSEGEVFCLEKFGNFHSSLLEKSLHSRLRSGLRPALHIVQSGLGIPGASRTFTSGGRGETLRVSRGVCAGRVTFVGIDFTILVFIRSLLYTRGNFLLTGHTWPRYVRRSFVQRGYLRPGVEWNGIIRDVGWAKQE